MVDYLWLIPLGFAVGACGTLIGAGGGFVLMPILLLVYPKDSPDLLTAISLAVVFCNAASGSVAYGRMRRIDYRSGLLMSAAAVPGAILGAMAHRPYCRGALRHRAGRACWCWPQGSSSGTRGPRGRAAPPFFRPTPAARASAPTTCRWRWA